MRKLTEMEQALATRLRQQVSASAPSPDTVPCPICGHDTHVTTVRVGKRKTDEQVALYNRMRAIGVPRMIARASMRKGKWT